MALTGPHSSAFLPTRRSPCLSGHTPLLKNWAQASSPQCLRAAATARRRQGRPPVWSTESAPGVARLPELEQVITDCRLMGSSHRHAAPACRRCSAPRPPIAARSPPVDISGPPPRPLAACRHGVAAARGRAGHLQPGPVGNGLRGKPAAHPDLHRARTCRGRALPGATGRSWVRRQCVQARHGLVCACCIPLL